MLYIVSVKSAAFLKPSLFFYTPPTAHFIQIKLYGMRDWIKVLTRENAHKNLFVEGVTFI